MTNKKLLYGILLAVAFVMTAGITYAYFSLIVSGNENATDMTVNTTTLKLKYTDGNQVTATGIEPGKVITKTLTVSNTGNETVYYTLGWQKLYNEIQKDELVIRSSCTTSDTTNGSCESTDNVVIPYTTEVTAGTDEVLYPYKERVKILSGETHTYTVTIEFINYTDKAQNYNQGKDFYGTLGVADGNSKLTDYLINNYEKLGLTKIAQAATGNQDYATVEYRYQGKTPNNYISFNGEDNKWRIIGVFEVETPNTDGTYIKEYKVKIVRDQIGTAAWSAVNSGTNYNDWTKATLKTLLNSGAYYNRTTANTKLACSTGSETTTSDTAICDYSSTGLTATAKSQISTTKWYLGNVIWSGTSYGTTTEVYTQERSTTVWNNNSQTWDGQVALIYPSDYMYASSACYNDSTKKGYDNTASSPYDTDYRNDNCKSTNWLYSGSWYWAVSPSSDFSYRAMIVDYDGGVGSNHVNGGSGGVRQSLYLDSKLAYTKGLGSTDQPYEVN